MSNASGMPWTSVMILLLLFLVILAAVVLIVRGLVGRQSADRRPGCGACGYAVKGLESLRCPECGVDLREVGIATPGGNAGRNAMLFTGIVLLALVMLLVCGGWFFAADSRQPSSHAVPSHGPVQAPPAPTP